MAEEKVDVLLSIDVEPSPRLQDIAKLRQTVSDLRKEQKELDRTTTEGAVEYERLNAQIKANNATIRQYEKEVQNTITLEKNQAGSIKALRAELSSAKAAYAELSAAEREGAVGTALLEKTAALNEQLKQLEGAYGDNQRRVGEYEQAITRAVGSNTLFGKTMQIVQGGVEGVQTGLKAGVTALGNFTKAALKFIATPIGAVIAAIGVVVGAVVAVFNKMRDTIRGNEEQSARLQRVLAPLKAVGDAVTRTFEALADVFLSVAENVSKAAVWLSDFLGITEDLTSATERYVQIEKDRLALTQETRKFRQREAEDEIRIADLRAQIADKEESTAAERIEMINEVSRLETALATERKRIAEENLRILEFEAAQTKNSAEFEDRLAAARVDVLRATSDLSKTEKELNALRSENAVRARSEAAAIAAASKARIDAAITEYETILKAQKELYEASIKAESDYQSQDFKTRQDYARRLEELDRETEKKRLDNLLAYNRITQDEYDRSLELMRLRLVEFTNAQTTELNAYFEQERKDIVAMLTQTLDEQIAAAEDAYREAIARLEKIEPPTLLAGESEESFAARLDEYEQFALEQANIAIRLEKQKDEQIKSIRESALAEQTRAIEAATAAEYADDLIRYRNNEMEKLEVTRRMLEDQIAAKKSAGLETLEDEAKLTDLQLEIIQKEAEAEQEIVDARIEKIQQWADTVSGLFANLSSLITANQENELLRIQETYDKEQQALADRYAMGLLTEAEYNRDSLKLEKQREKEQAKIERQQAIRDRAGRAFSVITDTAAAIVKAVRLSPGTFGMPWAAFAAATGALQLGTIMSAPLPKAAKGGLISGPSHANGGTVIEAEGGEAIMTKKAVSMFGPVLSSLNTLGGGVPFTGPLTDGGFVARSGGVVQDGELATKIAEAIRGLRIYTAVEDINRGQAMYAEIETGGRLI